LWNGAFGYPFGKTCTSVDIFTITEIEGQGRQKGLEQKVRNKMYKADLLTKARVEVIVKDGECDGIIKAITAVAHTGKIGDGKIFIHPVDDAVRIRTTERGDAAIG
jgi:nitrogen regulatory protein P-II 1